MVVGPCAGSAVHWPCFCLLRSVLLLCPTLCSFVQRLVLQAPVGNLRSLCGDGSRQCVFRVPFRRTPRPVPGRSVGGASGSPRSGAVSVAPSRLRALTLVTPPAPPSLPAAEGPAPLGSVRVHYLGSVVLL